MRYSWIPLLLLFFYGCAETNSVDDINQLQGYWEITKVEFPNGESKKYDISTTIDYIEYKEMKGFRKKLQPRLDGNFNTSNDAVYFTIENKNDIFIVRYQNELNLWEEKIRLLNKDQLVLVNEEGISYHYHRFNQISAE